MNQTVLVFQGPLEPRHKARLEAAAPGWTFIYRTKEEAAPQEWADADIILGNPLFPGVRETFCDLPRLKWVQLGTAGTDGYLVPGVLPEGCLLTCATGVFGPVIAEHLLAMGLALLYQMHRYRDNMTRGLWQRGPAARSFAGARVLIIGSGDIGTAFAQRAKALGAITVGVRRTPAQKPDCLDELHLAGGLDDLLPQADLVVMALPQTPETVGMMDRRRLGLMKRGAILLNVGRGSAIDTEALCDALDTGALGGAGLDVTDPEPLPPDHRLWRCPNALITPHISGYAAPMDAKIDLFAQNLAAYAQGQPLRSLVNPATGYRQPT